MLFFYIINTLKLSCMKRAAFCLIAILSWLSMSFASSPDIVAVKAQDVFSSTIQAVELLGGMPQYVKPGQRVGILVNSGFQNKGAYVDPDVVIATVKMAFDAGAADVVFLQHIVPEYWQRTPVFEQYSEMIAKTRSIEINKFPSVFCEDHFIRIPVIEGAKELANVEIVKEFFEVDVFINIPIAKNHSLTTLTNAMKNLMGLNTRASNVTFHLNGPSRNDPEYLAQCIADINLLRKADLIISDATYVIVTNGPNGPGEIVEPGVVVAGTDPVAIDAYCSLLVGFLIEDVISVRKGYESGLGEMDLSKVNILEVGMQDDLGRVKE
jgi:uncharacterized protein (DUF362 family)